MASLARVLWQFYLERKTEIEILRTKGQKKEVSNYTPMEIEEIIGLVPQIIELISIDGLNAKRLCHFSGKPPKKGHFSRIFEYTS